MTTKQLGGIKPAFKTGVMLRPVEYPLSIPIVLDFSTDSEIDFDLEREQTLGNIDFIQTIFVDNKDNTAAVDFKFAGGQTLRIPAGAQGYYPVTCEFGKFRAVITTTPSNPLLIPIQLLNVPVSSQQWGPITVNAAVTAAATPIVKNMTQTKFVLTGGDDILLAANGARTKLRLKAQPNNAQPFAFNYGAAAVLADNENVMPGFVFDSGTGPVSGQQIRGIGTAGDIVIITEG